MIPGAPAPNLELAQGLPQGRSQESPTPAVGEWDAFLRDVPQGQFQQASSWAVCKRLQGWRCHRQRLQLDGQAIGGFQLLWRDSRFGRIGYISKGPVLERETPEAIAMALRQITHATSTLRLRALILQPPDASGISADDLARHGFAPASIPSVVDSTLLVDLQAGPLDVERRMSRKPRQHARNARAAGIKVFVGGRQHLTDFFDLMQQTCRRRGVRPHPPSVGWLETLWDEFAPAMRLSFARQGENLLAGLLMLGFGDRITFWKKGWVGSSASAGANALLNASELDWASRQGYRVADFGAIDRDIAERILGNRELTDEQLRSRDMFNLRLGGRPQLLPPALIRVTNPLIRPLLNAQPCSRWFSAMVGRLSLAA